MRRWAVALGTLQWFSAADQTILSIAFLTACLHGIQDRTHVTTAVHNQHIAGFTITGSYVSRSLRFTTYIMDPFRCLDVFLPRTLLAAGRVVHTSSRRICSAAAPEPWLTTQDYLLQSPIIRYWPVCHRRTA